MNRDLSSCAMTRTMTVSSRRKLRRPLSLGDGSSSSTSPKSLASAPSPTMHTSRELSLRPAATTSTGLTFRRYTGNGTVGFEQTQSLSPSRRRTRGRSTSPKPHIFEERPLPTAYASLPPSPILRPRSITPPPSILPIPQGYTNVQPGGAPFSLWDYLREELLATDFDSHQELKWERVRNFLNMPLAMEKVSNLLSSFDTDIVINPLQDNWLWIYSVLRLFLIYIYNSSYPLCLSPFSICVQYFPSIASTSSSIAES